MVAFQLVNMSFDFQIYKSYVATVWNMMDESRGVVNPCLMTLLKDICEWAVAYFGMSVDYNRWANILYLSLGNLFFLFVSYGAAEAETIQRSYGAEHVYLLLSCGYTTPA